MIELLSTGIQNGFRLRNDHGSKWPNSTDFVVKWSMKYSEFFRVYIDSQTTEGHLYSQNEPIEGGVHGNSEYVVYGLGSGANKGKWQTFTRDLQVDHQNVQPNVGS